MIQVATPAVHQAGKGGRIRGPRGRHDRSEGAGAVVDVKGFVAVLRFDFFHLLGDFVQGLLPADFDPFASTTFRAGFTLQGLLQPIRIVYPVPNGATAHASTHGLRAEFVRAGVVRQNSYYPTVLNLQLQWAARTTVHGTSRPHQLGVVRCSRVCLRRARKGAFHAQQGGGSRSHTGPL